MGYVTSVSLSREMDDLRRKYKISVTEACRVGLSVILSEMNVREYDNNLNVVRKMRNYQKLAEEANQKLDELTKKRKKK